MPWDLIALFARLGYDAKYLLLELLAAQIQVLALNPC